MPVRSALREIYFDHITSSFSLTLIRVCMCVCVCVCVCVFVLVYMCQRVFPYCIFLIVSVCDIVELGTYGKLKYYHSMTEEGKTLSVNTNFSLSASSLYPQCRLFMRVCEREVFSPFLVS